MSSGRDEMDEFSLLKKLATVKAPPDFEQTIMARLSLAQRGEARRRPAWGLSLAGAFASLLAVFVALNVFVLRERTPVSALGKKGEVAASARPTVPVIETFDYGAEIRSRAPESGTIYRLEQVSDTTSKGITY